MKAGSIAYWFIWCVSDKVNSWIKYNTKCGSSSVCRGWVFHNLNIITFLADSLEKKKKKGEKEFVELTLKKKKC